MPIIIPLKHRTTYHKLVSSLQQSFPEFSARPVKRKQSDAGKWLSHAAYDGPIDALPADFEVGILVSAKTNDATESCEVKQWLRQKAVNFSEI